MNTDRYRTLAGAGQSELREKASRFIGLAFPITDVEHFERELHRIRKEHHTARHWCYAYVLGPRGDRTRSNDDGEPSGTAGRPILRHLQAADLTYAAVIVVRYFGGTLLGKGGLVQAYGGAARMCLEAAPTEEIRVREEVHVTCSYAQYDHLRTEMVKLDAVVVRSMFGEVCELVIAVPLGSVPGTIQRWRDQGIAVASVDPMK